MTRYIDRWTGKTLFHTVGKDRFDRRAWWVRWIVRRDETLPCCRPERAP